MSEQEIVVIELATEELDLVAGGGVVHNGDGGEDYYPGSGGSRR